MLLDAAARLGLDLARSVMVGDRWRDIEAGPTRRRATPCFVDRGYAERAPDRRRPAVHQPAASVGVDPRVCRGTDRRSSPSTADLDRLDVKIFADGADLESMVALAENPLIRASRPTRP